MHNNQNNITALMGDVGSQLGAKFNVNAHSSQAEIASAITSAMQFGVKTGLDPQIAIIEFFTHIQVLQDKYRFFRRGKLEFGIGKTKITTGIKKSTKFDRDNAPWTPSGPKDKLLKVQTTSTGWFERRVANDYEPDEIKTWVRDGNLYAQIIAAERNICAKTKDIEDREMPRYFFGVDNDYLPADYKTELAPIKDLFQQNKITVNDIADPKSVINYLNTFMPEYLDNISNKYNIGGKQGSEFIQKGGVDTTTKALDNTATVADTVLVISNTFHNHLIQTLGNVYNTEYWTNFTKNYGRVIIETYPEAADQYQVYIFDKDVLEIQEMFDSYNLTYYPENRTYRSLAISRTRVGVNLFLNGFTIVFKKSASRTLKVEEQPTEEGNEPTQFTLAPVDKVNVNMAELIKENINNDNALKSLGFTKKEITELKKVYKELVITKPKKEPKEPKTEDATTNDVVEESTEETQKG